MTDIELVENVPLSLPLGDSAGRALAGSGVVEATPDLGSAGWWRVRAKNVVGVAAVRVAGGETITVRVSPKVPINRLMFLLGYSRSFNGWRDDQVQVDDEPDLLPVFARVFALHAEQALQQGLLKGYREVEETAQVMRGRIRFSEQVRRHHGLLVPLEITHDEYTTDVAENRLIRSACEVLLRLPDGIPGDVRTRLARLKLRLADVTPVPHGHPLPAWRPNRLNVRYHDALRVAELVLRGESVEHRPGEVTVHGFLFNLAKVFEDFITVALRDALGQSGGYSVLQASHHLDDRNAIRMVPDFVHYEADGTPLAVVDAKYKAQRPDGFPDADLYQMLAYCTALNLPEGHLVYAKGNAPHGAHRVRYAGTVLHQHAVDLDQPSAGVLADIRTVAQRLVSS
ncbi:5-methylcytosine-specific restriction enzyme subunit McrC [Saccharopolyspora kobensis]|uniref:5-methylcytosine-specific restriction enzyme subunit McrC n=1 Tax=Saccharopolyspora kobensis TaxID=146035 RepID=A0A1H5SZV5_9PSEU|nr:restriction endonuclease [Saccharopolyspora kobensis]SEF56059.1 5-methylcytosine-specific restriction enzyme subunit McrC [Saccharopolyspora kobensis]SFC51990.1 5-methylcytosine-specific restriction enzyme subunit McrC [Saccharopolyspora kobensis]